MDAPSCLASLQAAGIEAARMLVYKSAWLHDQGQRNTQYVPARAVLLGMWRCGLVTAVGGVFLANGSIASMAKLLAADHANKVAADAVQVGVLVAAPTATCCSVVSAPMLSCVSLRSRLALRSLVATASTRSTPSKS